MALVHYSITDLLPLLLTSCCSCGRHLLDLNTRGMALELGQVTKCLDPND